MTAVIYRAAKVPKLCVMKTILLLTDFSPNATAAAEAALLLAQRLRLNLLLFNSYMRHLELPASLSAGWDVEEFSARHHHSKLNMETLTEGLEALSQQDASAYQPVISSVLNDEDLGISLEELTRQYPIAIVIIGAMTGKDNGYIHEANINSVINVAKRPVCIIPEKTDLLQLRKIIFATNFNEADIPALHFLMMLGHALNYQIDVVHIETGEEKEPDDMCLRFEEQLLKINYTGLSYKKITTKNIPDGLSELCSRENALLGLVHRHLSFFTRLFEKSITKRETVQQDFPLIIFPDQLSAYDN